MDDDIYDKSIFESYSKISTNIKSFSFVENLGKTNPIEIPKDTNDNDLFSIIFTSGTTSVLPKGVMHSRLAWKLGVMRRVHNESLIVDLSFSPLAHTTPRRHIACFLCNGGKTAFYQGDMNRIYEDFALIRPTMVIATPRFWNKLYEEYRLVFNEGISKGLNPTQADDQALKKLSSVLGDRVRLISTGGAPTRPEVIDFLNRCFHCRTSEGYGTTEAGGIMSNGILSVHSYFINIF